MKKLFLIVTLVFCISVAYPQKLFWLDGSASLIQTINLNGSGFTTTLSGIKPGFGCAYDAASGFIYYTDMVNNEIKKVKDDGTLNQVVVTQAVGLISIPRGIALNLARNRIYWSDNGTGKIKKADISGTNAADVVTGLNSPSFVAYDNINMKIYWVDNGTGVKKIQRCDTTGANIQDFVTGLTSVWGIGLDLLNGYLYWIDEGTDKLQKKLLSDPVPANKLDVVTGLTGNQRGLAVDVANSKIYWTSVSPPSSSTINRANLDGTSPVSFVSSLNYPQGIALDWNSGLPVEFMNFASSVNDGSVLLFWETKTEINAIKFIIERKESEDNSFLKQWSETGEVFASGNSNSSKTYTYKDTPSKSGKYIYRIKLLDSDGNIQFSNSIEVDVGSPVFWSLSQNYPNPFNPSTKINYNLPLQSSVQLKLFDALGKEFAVLINKVQDAGFYSYTVDSKSLSLSSGIYFYRLTAVNSTGSFSEIKKMILLK